MNDFYKNPTVSNAALNAFFKRNSKSGEVHSVKLIHHGKTMLRIAIPPYSADDRRESYSLSKSFMSTAVGLLVNEGKISLDDRIVDLFPEKCPETISENLAKMRIRHLLSMNAGHESCVMGSMAHADDPVKAFLAEEVKFEPGTHFAYNTGASCMLACIVEKFTGMNTLDYLSAKLLVPMGIYNITWSQIKNGTQQGGCGIHVNCDDLIKLGQLYLAGGVWEGKRYLTEEWVKEATSKISDNAGNGSPDWCAGYGFQFWRNSKEGYRGDGAFGQLLLVFPERDMIVAVQGLLGDMWGEVESVYDLIDNLYNEDSEPLALPEYAPLKSDKKATGLENTYYLTENNPMGFSAVYLTRDDGDDTLSIHFSDGENTEEVRAGNGHWVNNVIVAKGFKPCMPSFQPDFVPKRLHLAASYSTDDEKTIFSIRFRNCPHPMIWTLTGNSDSIKLLFEDKGFMMEGADKLIGKKFPG